MTAVKRLIAPFCYLIFRITMRRSRMEKAMDLRKAIYSRRAVREFSAEPVDEKTLRQLINAAILAPSAVNMLRTSPAALASHHFQEPLGNPEFDVFYHAPVLIVISALAESPWAVEDCSLAVENMIWLPAPLGWEHAGSGLRRLGLERRKRRRH